uniref:protein HEG homolog 1 n=1 Tax=Jaculus jaculus TaxID=51337 RepID=UPI001E1B5264|nr:protein HEG homolog 1 [Jaculus jaculus]
MAQMSRTNHTSSQVPDHLTLPTETSGAEGRTASSSRTNVTLWSAKDSPEIRTAVASQGATSSSGNIKEVTNTAPESQTKSHTATAFTNGVPRMLRSLAVSMGLVNETEGPTEDSRTSASGYSSPSVVETSKVTEDPGEGEFTEPSTENEFGLTPLQGQSDSPTFGGPQLASSSEAGRGRPMLRESTAPWGLTNSETATNVTESSVSHLDVANSSVLTQLSGGNSGSGERGFSESSATSSSESLDSSVPLGERSTLEDTVALSDSSDSEEGTSWARSHGTHTSATLTRSGERTLRSLSLTDAATSAEVGSAARSTRRRNVTDHTGLLPGSSAVQPALGVTGLSYGQSSGTDTEQRTSGDHTDRTYMSSAATKEARVLPPITDNGSSSNVSESAMASVETSDALYSDYPSPSQTQTERSGLSSDGGTHAQSSTEALGPHTSSLPSYTSTIHVPNTWVHLHASTDSVGDSSSSGAPLPLPSASQSRQLFLSTLPSIRSSTSQLKSTSEAAVVLSSSTSPFPISLVASTPVPRSVSQTAFPHSSSTLGLHRTRETHVTSVQTSTVASAIGASHSNQTADSKSQSTLYQEKTVTEARSPSLVSAPTASTKAVTSFLPGVPVSPAFTGSSTKPALAATSASLAPVSPALITTMPQTTVPPVTNPSTLSSTEALIPSSVYTTAGKQLLPAHPEISTESASSTERNQGHVDAATSLIPPTGAPTPAEDSATRLGMTEESSPDSRFLPTSPSPQTTDVSTADVLTPKSTTVAAQSTPQSPTALSHPASANSCATNPCLHDGKCVVNLSHRGYRCVCPPSWQGDNCSEDVNECLSNPCPPLAMCNNTQGSFICKCPVGYQLEKGICNLVRTFVTEFKLKKTFLNTTAEKHSELHKVENEITRTLNMCFSTLPGYIRSTVHAARESNAVGISLQTTFALASNVTLFDLADGIQKYVNSCRSSAEVCQLLGSQRRIFRAGSLCKRKNPECDKETSICTDLDGIALCQCKSGYFQFNKMDHSCRACEDGYRLENETCMSCPFGLGGLNCGNPYQLITVVIAAAGGGLLLLLGIALIVTCCRKSKNDISKLIFKSGDFQMSPYAEYPKNPRSQEWGREAIEMHENGSTKNLLQVTDVYYSPTNVRNPELERNGLYPAYTGLPGSRHSCVFPGQYNPSFISDESRRRDYF